MLYPPFLLFSFESSSCILDVSPLSDVSNLQIFSLGLEPVFSFCEQHIFHRAKNFNSELAQPSICSFMDYAFCIIFNKSLPNPRSLRLFPMFSYRCFIVFGFTFRYMIHFDLTFCMWYKVQIRVHAFCMWISSCSGTICLNDHSLFTEFSLYLCQNHQSIYVGLFGTLCFSDLFVCLYASTTLS